MQVILRISVGVGLADVVKEVALLNCTVSVKSPVGGSNENGRWENPCPEGALIIQP